MKGERGRTGGLPQRPRRTRSGRRAVRAVDTDAPGPRGDRHGRREHVRAQEAQPDARRRRRLRRRDEVRRLLVPVRRPRRRELRDPGRRRSSTPATRTRSPDTYNLQVQKPARRARRPQQRHATGTQSDEPYGVGLDDTLDTDGNPPTPGDPCSSQTLDVKATDHDVPLLTSFFPFRPDAKSKARVEIRQILEQNGDAARGPCPRWIRPRSPPSS